MNQIIQFDQTMTSRQIAAATGKEHFHVLRDIRTMLDELGIDHTQCIQIWMDRRNREQTEYHLDRDLTLTLVSGYSAKLRYAVVRRMRALEAIVLEQQLTEHGHLVRDRAIIETTLRTTKIENELRAEIKELRQQIAEAGSHAE